MKTPLIDIRPDHWAIVRDILHKRVPQYEVWAFGSRAKWSAKEYSDLDLAVVTDKPLGLSTSAALADDFSESDLPWKVDLVDWATTSESFRKIIERDRVVVQKVQAGRNLLENKWRNVRIDEIANKVVIGPFGSRMKSDLYTESGVPVIRGTNLTGGKNFSGDWVYVSDETADELSNCNVIEGDLVFPHRGAIGEVGIVPGDRDRYLLSTSLMMLRCDPSQAYSPYLYYFFKSRTGRHELLKNASQVGTPGIGQPLTSLKSIEVALPSVDEQRSIAHILGTLDDKIELNRRMNETLEAIARAIFKSWFVDFDPVRAKASGEAPESICRRLGLTPDLLALFPDRLVDSELGEIPEGWEVKPLDGIADYLNGLALQKFPPESDSEWLPVIKIAQLKKGDSVGADHASYDLKYEYIVDDGDVLFSWSGSLEVDIWCGGRGALNQHLFKVTSDNYPKWFYFYWTKHHLLHFKAIAAGKAVTMGHIQRKHLTEALCVIPQQAIMERLDEIVAPLLDKQIENRKESRTLGVMRDTLLPKLLSGELRIPAVGAA